MNQALLKPVLLPAWIDHLADGDNLPPEPGGPQRRRWSSASFTKASSFLLGLCLGLGSAYLAYHTMRGW